MSTNDMIDVERADDVATITLDRPNKLNAVSLELLQQFQDVLADLHDDPAGALVLTGTGDVTCAGMDQDLVTDPDYHEKYQDEIDRLNDAVFDYLATYPGPTVVAAKGAIVGEGFIFSMNCDFVVAGEETHISLPEIQYGIDASHRLPAIARLVGDRVAKEMGMTGEPIDPRRALDVGLVNDVVPEADVDETAQSLAADLVQFDQDILLSMKESTRADD